MATSISYFLGANSPSGFYSRFWELQADPRVRRTLLIKGGPGCGKSTFMRRLADAALSAGADVEYGLCSSDPDSLDTLLIPACGLAVADATAPHVVEPLLCGCGAAYLNFSVFYDSAAVSRQADALHHWQKQNQSYYIPARHCLQALAACCELPGQLVDAVQQRLQACALQTADSLLPIQMETGSLSTRFFSAYTPDGPVFCQAAISHSCEKIIALRGAASLSGVFLQTLLEIAQSRGLPIIAGYDPLAPAERLQQLLFPSCSLGFVAAPESADDRSYAGMLDLASISGCAQLPKARLKAAARLKADLEHELTWYLSQAKAAHDELEALLIPCVDFDAVDLLTEKYRQEITAQLHVLS